MRSNRQRRLLGTGALPAVMPIAGALAIAEGMVTAGATIHRATAARGIGNREAGTAEVTIAERTAGKAIDPATGKPLVDLNSQLKGSV